MRLNFEMKGPIAAHTEVADKEFRDALVEVEVRRGLPVQIREMREERGWPQAQLGEMIGKPQNNISRIENSREGYLSLKTLLDIASAFDVALLVKFVPFSELLRWTDNHGAETVVPKSYDAEIAAEAAEAAARTQANVTEIREYLLSELRTEQRRPARRSSAKNPQRISAKDLYGTDNRPASSAHAVFSDEADQSTS